MTVNSLPLRSSPPVRILAFLGILTTFVLVWAPYVTTLVFATEFVSTGNESLAYRYFLSERAWTGRPGFVWQGHLTSVIQHAVYGALQMPIFAVSGFRTQLQAFASLTLMLNAFITSLVLVFAMLDKHLKAPDRALVAIAALAPIYCLGNQGPYYALLPDYYAFDISLAAATVWLTLRLLRASDVSKAHMPVWVVVGIVTGLLAGNKATMGLLALPAVAALVVSERRSIIIVTVTAAATLFLLFFAYYLGDIREILAFPATCVRLVRHSQG